MASRLRDTISKLSQHGNALLPLQSPCSSCVTITSTAQLSCTPITLNHPSPQPSIRSTNIQFAHTTQFTGHSPHRSHRNYAAAATQSQCSTPAKAGMHDRGPNGKLSFHYLISAQSSRPRPAGSIDIPGSESTTASETQTACSTSNLDLSFTTAGSLADGDMITMASSSVSPRVEDKADPTASLDLSFTTAGALADGYNIEMASSTSADYAHPNNHTPSLDGAFTLSGSLGAGEKMTETQDASDPGGREDDWSDFRVVVRERQEQEMDTPELARGPRGKGLIVQMQSWGEMADWVSSFENSAHLFPSELARMWTQIVQVHMMQGKGGLYDEKMLIYPDAPLFSADGREFLLRLCDATKWRLKISLKGEGASTRYEQKYRLRAPDAARILWASGKLRWRDKALVKMAEKVIIQDIGCEWNKPRYMSTALWGVAWAHQRTAVPHLCAALQAMPSTFWDGMTVQNATNTAWAMAQMRFRPSVEFHERLETVLLTGLQETPGLMHPQNIGDFLQAKATWDYPAPPSLVAATEPWMRANLDLMTYKHLLAYLNGLALLGELKRSTFLFYAAQLENMCSRCSHSDLDSVAQRVYVLAHLTYEDSSSEVEADGAITPFLRDMTARGQGICTSALQQSGDHLSEDECMIEVGETLASIGYSHSIAALEALGSGDFVTPILPDAYIRSRSATGPAGSVVGLQLIGREHCFRNGDNGPMGEVIMARKIMQIEGLPVVAVHKQAWAEAEDKAGLLLEVLKIHIAPGTPAVEELSVPAIESKPAESFQTTNMPVNPAVLDKPLSLAEAPQEHMP